VKNAFADSPRTFEHGRLRVIAGQLALVVPIDDVTRQTLMP
jgi:hypothetical protein